MAALYALSLLFRLDAAQHRVAHFVTLAIQKKASLPLSVGSIRVHHLDKIVLKEIIYKDERGDTAINIPKITAHISPAALLKGNIKVNTLMIGAPAVALYRETPESPLNIQPLLDKFAGDDSKEKSKLPDIKINLIQLYDGSLRYDEGKGESGTVPFNPSHIALHDINCNLSLKQLNSDTLSLYIRSISGKEASGLQLQRLTARVNASRDNATIEKLSIELPHSTLKAKKLAIASQGKKKFTIKGEINGNKISPSDFSFILPTLAGSLPTVNVSVAVKGNEKLVDTDITVGTSDKSITIGAEALITDALDSNARKIKLTIPGGKIRKDAVAHLQRIVSDSTHKLDILKRIGDIRVSAQAHTTKNNIKGDIDIYSPSGNVTVKATMDKSLNYSAILQAHDINWGAILQDKNIGTSDADISLQGDCKAQEPQGVIVATMKKLKYKGYEYAPIEITASHSIDSKIATIECRDTNATGEITFSYTSDKEKEFELRAKIDSVKPMELHISKSEGTLSATMEGSYTIKNDERTLLDARIYNITHITPDEEKYIRTIHLNDNNLSDTRYLILNSDFLDANIAGHFNYSSLLGTFNKIIHNHLSALTDGKTPRDRSNEYSFKFDIKDTYNFSSIFGLPVTINERSSIVGSCDDNRKFLYIDAKLNNADINGDKYRNIDFTGVANSEKINFDASIKIPQVVKNNILYDNTEKDMTIEINSSACRNTIKNRIFWTRNTTPVNKGTFEFDIALDKKNDGTLIFDAGIKPNEIIYYNNLWHLSPCRVTGNGNRFTVSNLHLNSNRQWIKIDGDIGNSDEDILAISLNDINMETIFDLVNFHSVEFGGDATGDVTLSRLLDSPQFSSALNVKKFSFEKGHLGELDFRGTWDEEQKAIFIHGDVYDVDDAHTVISGIISPANDTINLHIDADRTRLAFLNSMLEGILTDIDAHGTGDVWVVGKLRDPNLIGNAKAVGKMKLVPTNTTYELPGDTVYMSYNKIAFKNLLLTDSKKNKGYLTGSVDHNCLSNFTCNLNIEAENILAYHSEGFSEQLPFYGTAYATGMVNLTADKRGVFLHAKVRSDEGSSFVYNASSTGNVTNSNFITFTDNSKAFQSAHNLRQNRRYKKEEKKQKSLLSRLNLEFMLDITPDFQLKVFTNLKTGDYIDFYGNGPITAIYDEKEGFSMKGRLDLERGTYKFTMQDIFPKEFDIIKGSTLTFNGDPFAADLNLKTKYLVTGASLSDLDPETERHKSVRVNCLMDISGKLESPQLAFDIELPDGNEEERELLATAVNTPEQKNMQFIYLLGIGKFYTYDYYRNIDSNTQSSSAVESLISNTISGQLSNMLSQIIDNKNWNISGNFSSNERGWSNMEVEGILEGRLLDNRLLINGNFGYRENPMANTNFVGDFEVQWILDKNGRVSLKAYNKTNDRYFSETTLTTQGAGIILRHDFNDWRWWLRNKKKETAGEVEK